jgi:hypothetical protein
MARVVAVTDAITYPGVGGLLGILTLNRIVRCSCVLLFRYLDVPIGVAGQCHP